MNPIITWAVRGLIHTIAFCLRTPLWCGRNLPALTLGVTVLAGALVWLREHLAKRVLSKRVRYTLTPSRRFDPGAEDIWRYAALLLRAARSGPWWVPARAKAVRLRLRADGTGLTPLAYSVEGHTTARHLLAGSPYAQVEVARTRPARDKARKHTLRAEFVLRGDPAAPLREVPLQPDPLQPIVDAVAAVRADLGDLAEVVLDLQPVPGWRLRLRRWHLMTQARARAQHEARKATRRALADSDALEDSLAVQLAQLLDGQGGHGGRRLSMTVRPRPVEAQQVWGRLADDVGLVRLQLLVRCASDQQGRAEQALKSLTAALDVFAGRSRLRVDGTRLGPWTWSANHPLRRRRFDRRWRTAAVIPRRDSWLHIGELAGLLKPPTAHCRQPITAGTLPEYEIGAALMPQGWYRGPDGTTRLIASPLAETLFSVAVGKAYYGKTTRAVVQALAVAHAGQGVFFLDPHADSWNLAAPYLAHDTLRDRVWRIDLTGRDETARLPSWNSLGMDAGQRPDDVVRSVVDSFATVLGWDDQSAPRALTIFTKALQALVEVNRQAVAANRPGAQATLFQVRALLTDQAFREAVLEHLPAQARAWWTTSFTAYGEDAFSTVLNPLDRLAADPIARALLGAPTGKWNARTAMDRRRIVWVCLGGTGPTQRLLVNLLLRDLFRAGLSRGDLPPKKRKPFHLFVDELISLDSAGAGGTIAEITEQLRKFGIRMHTLVQLLERINPGARMSLLQNASALSTTAGSLGSVGAVTEQWHGALTVGEVAELPRYHHAVSFTVDGRTLGPLKIRGPQPDEVFRHHRAPKHLGELCTSADQAIGARTARYLHGLAAKQDSVVLAFLTTPARRPARGAVQQVQLTKPQTEFQ